MHGETRHTESPLAASPGLSRVGRIPWTRRWGIGLALVTACISGFSVFVNSYAVKSFSDATAYSTVKNLVAAVLLGGAALAAAARRSPARLTRPRTRAQVVGLVVVAIVGGSVPFALFFEGLARASAKDAAFLQKTLVVWVLVLAVVFLRERVGWLQVGAVAVLVAGQALLGVRWSSLQAESGELMILLATLLWAVEVIVAKRLLSSLSPLTVGLVRMGGGVVVLVVYLAARADLAHLVPDSAGAWGWALVTGALLAAYVATWFAALARADAVDVTAVLVVGALITALLDAVAHGTQLAPQALGLILVAGGTLVVVVRTARLPVRSDLDAAPREASAP